MNWYNSIKTAKKDNNWEVYFKIKSIMILGYKQAKEEGIIDERGMVETLEGPQKATEKHVICKGDKGEYWPMEKSKLEANFYKGPPCRCMGWSEYFPKGKPVEARQENSKDKFKIKSMEGKRGDYIVRRKDDKEDVWIVDKKIFEDSYLTEDRYKKTDYYKEMKQAQAIDPLVQQYNQLINQNPSTVNITGSGVGETISLPGGKNIVVKELLDKAVSLIRPVLIKNRVNTIDTSPISNPNAAGVAISNEPGKIHIDIKKLVNQIKNHALPSISQLDGTNTDPDIINNIVKKISSYLLSEIGEVVAHESKHNLDYTNLYQQGKPFTDAQESPAEQFGKSTRRQYFSQEFL